MSVPINPSRSLMGEQYSIEYGGQIATVMETGATLRSYEVDSIEVIHPFQSQELAPSSSGQVLFPWPNRIRGGRYKYGGSPFQLPLNDSSLRHAIHGFARWLPWSLKDRGNDFVEMSLRVVASPGFPFSLSIVVRYSLSKSGFRCDATVANESPRPSPWGLGFHPYFSFGSKGVDEMLVEVRARNFTYFDSDHGLAPWSGCSGTPMDLSRPSGLEGVILDTTFSELERDGEGSAVVVVSAGKCSGSIWMDNGFPYLQLFTADTLSGGLHRRALAVEPMTCPPDAFNSPDKEFLEPSEVRSLSWGIRVHTSQDW